MFYPNLKSVLVALLIITSSIKVEAQSTKIGVLIPETGNYASLGDDCRLGLEIARENYDLKNLKIIYADSQAENKVAITEFNRLVETENVSAVLLSRSNVGLAVNPYSLKKKIPILGMVGHEEFVKQNPYAFQFWPKTEDEGAKLAQALLASGKRRVSIIMSEDEWLLNLGRYFKTSFLAGGGEVLQEELIPIAETDISTVLLRASAKKPDAIYLNVAHGTIAPGLRRIYERSPQAEVVSNFWVGKPEVIEAAGKEQTEGVGFVEVSLKQKKFLEAYEKLKSKRNPTGMTYDCYSAFVALGNITSDGKSLSPIEVQERLLKLTSIKLLDEDIPISGRIVSYTLAYKEIHDMKVVEK
jgi:branched-chain amino acid transport system substrate-binding protein